MSLLNNKTAPLSILLIGSGRLAQHLQHWIQLSTEKIYLQTWDRHQNPQRIQQLKLNADIVWLAISDKAIIPFFEKHLQGMDKVVVHFSGQVHHPQMIGCHPLMTFSSNLYSDQTYQEIPFAICGADDLKSILPGFTNPFFKITAEQKSLYHALCVVSGNFPQMLWAEASKICEAEQIPYSHFKMLCEYSLKNFFDHGPTALTGPFVRKDFETIDKNISALPAPLKEIYQSFKKELL